MLRASLLGNWETGKDYTCGLLNGVNICAANSESSDAYASFVNLQVQANRLAALLPGISTQLSPVSASGSGIDGRIGPDTRDLVAQVGLRANDLQAAPDALLPIFRAPSQDQIAANAVDIANYFQRVADNFQNLWYSYMQAGTTQVPDELQPVFSPTAIQAAASIHAQRARTFLWVMGGIAAASVVGVGAIAVKRRLARRRS